MLGTFKTSLIFSLKLSIMRSSNIFKHDEKLGIFRDYVLHKSFPSQSRNPHRNYVNMGIFLSPKWYIFR